MGKVKSPLLDAMMSPFPPLGPMIRLLLKLGTADAVRLAHLLVQPANIMVDRMFAGEAPRLCCWAAPCTPTLRWMRREAARSAFC
ncbi:hypothetical protein NIIDMKKI_27510 [Mycobacterium kansasii]|uniref:Uncharacterized protein n=1 Tax=Mycobacterium kansasii TaxID=1768 RepID=A0A7G1ICT0_MYCKA|nr:hypothetical protein NIIDMKKI_27510 [Mycobacterium kansasii]